MNTKPPNHPYTSSSSTGAPTRMLTLRIVWLGSSALTTISGD